MQTLSRTDAGTGYGSGFPRKEKDTGSSSLQLLFFHLLGRGQNAGLAFVVEKTGKTVPRLRQKLVLLSSVVWHEI